MRNGHYVMQSILESGLASTKLCTILRMLMGNCDKDIFVDELGFIQVSLDGTNQMYPLTASIEDIINEAVRIAIRLGMSKEDFAPVGKAIDKL